MEESLWQSAVSALGEVFRLPGFRDGQESIVRSVLEGRDTLAVMPTGGGKSLCYQLPGYVLPGLTLVISPLIALMKDQVDSLLARGIRAVNLHSGLTYSEQQAVCDEVASGRVKFLFVAPERVRSPGFQSLLRRTHIGLLAVDEAHCISQWGHDFRPDYRRLGNLREELGRPSTIALTATASPEVQKDIVAQLELENPGVFIMGFDRLNLRFGVEIFRTEKEKLEYALGYVSQRIQQRCGFKRSHPGCGIIYAATIKQAEAAAAYFNDHGICAGLYHAGLPPAIRNQVQEQFMNDEFHCLVATTAFGMGVDKPDIRYVLHLSMSSSVEAYTQESGRAGRDRQPAECMLLYSAVDAKIQEHFIDGGCPDLTIYRTIMEMFSGDAKKCRPEQGTRVALQKILDRFERRQQGQLDTALRKLRARDMIQIGQDGLVTWNGEASEGLARELAEESRVQKKSAKARLSSLVRYVYEEDCRTKFILNYFGSQDAHRFRRCHHCDLCRAMPIRPQAGEPGAFPPEPLHYVLLKYLSTISRCHKAHLSVTSRQIASILTGSTGEPALTGISTFGLLGYMDAAEILVLTGILRTAGVITTTGGQVEFTESGLKMLTSRTLEQFPNTVQQYMRTRFVRAPRHGDPWKP